MRLNDGSESLDSQSLDNEIAEKFYEKSLWGGRVQAIVPMPQVMVAKPLTLFSLRHSAVLLQADALLIIKPVYFSNWKYKWFEENVAKGTTSVEILLMDTRTNVVPFTSVITESTEIIKSPNDYDQYELMNRAKKLSESKALLQIPKAIGQFINSSM